MRASIRVLQRDIEGSGDSVSKVISRLIVVTSHHNYRCLTSGPNYQVPRAKTLVPNPNKGP